MNFVEALVALATQQLAWQFDTYTSLETKAIGLLAFDGALGAFIAVLHPMPEYLRWIFFTPLVISVLGCICSLWVRTVYTGPNGEALYNWTRDQGNDTEDSLALVTNLNADVQRNRDIVAQKGLYWNISAVALIVAIVVVGIDFIFF